MLGLLYQELLDRELPPEVDDSYMAEPDEIRSKAAQSLERYKQDRHYQLLLDLEGKVSQKIRMKVHLDAILGYARRLETAIIREDLVAMRLHRDPESYLSCFEDCADELREYLAEQTPDLVPAPPYPTQLRQAAPHNYESVNGLLPTGDVHDNKNISSTSGTQLCA